MLARGIYLKVVIVLVLMPILLVSLTGLEASPNKNIASPLHVSLKDHVLIAGVFHYLDVTSDIENENICIIAYSGDTLPEPGVRSVKNYYRWEYNHGVWKDESGHDSSYIDPSKCTKENSTYSFYIGISDKANPGSWTIKIFVNDKEKSSASLNVVIGDFCFFFSTIIGMFQPSIKDRNLPVDKDLICCYKERKMVISEKDIDRIVDGLIKRRTTSLTEEKSVDKNLHSYVLNNKPPNKEEPARSAVYVYPKSKLKEIKNDRNSSLFFDVKVGGGNGFYRMKLDSCKRFFVIMVMFIFFSASLIPIVVLPGENKDSGDITTIDVQSSSLVEREWTVMLKTFGRANLMITAVNGTTWSSTAESYDLKFLELRCGNETLGYEWVNDSIFVGNYSSDEICYETSQIIAPGVHTLMFCFGNDTVFASNPNSESQLQTNNSDLNDGTKNSIDVSSNSSLLNETYSIPNASFIPDVEFDNNLSSDGFFENTSTGDLSNVSNQEYEDNNSGKNITTIYDNFWEEKAISYDGDIGSVEMDYNKAWKYVLGHVTWNIQANVNDNWQNTNGLMIDYVNLTEDSKKFSLYFFATIQPQADYRLVLSMGIPVDDYSFDSGKKTFNLFCTVSGHRLIFEYNYSDIAGIPDLIFDHGINDSRFWFSIQINNVAYGTDINLDPTFYMIGDGVISSYQYAAVEGRTESRNAVVRLNNSQYYLTCAKGESDDGWLRTIKVWDNNGTVQNTGNVSWYQYDTSDGLNANVIQIPGTDKYAVAYADLGSQLVKVVTVQVWATNGTIRKSIIDTISLGIFRPYTTALDLAFLRLTNNVYCIAFRNFTAPRPGWLETIWINSSGTINDTILSKRNFAPAVQGMDMCVIDSDTIAITYTPAAVSAILLTYNITSSGIIAANNASYWNFDATAVAAACPDIYPIGNNIFAIAYSWTGTDGEIFTCTIANTGMITQSKISTFEFDEADCLYPYIFNIASEVYGIAYEGSSADGWVNTIGITSAGIIDTVYDRLEFDSADCLASTYPNVVKVANQYFLIVYTSTSGYGWAKTVNISTMGHAVVYAENDGTLANSPTTYNNGRKLARDSLGNLYTVFYRARTSDSTTNIVCGKSTDNGTTWTCHNITNVAYAKLYPSIAVDSTDKIHVVWQGYNSVQIAQYQIEYSNSTNGGLTWSTPYAISRNIPRAQQVPSIAINSTNALFVVWYGIYSGSSPGNINKIRFSKSTNSGSTWTAPTNISGSAVTNAKLYPSIAIDSNNKIHVVWQGYNTVRTTVYQIEYSNSTNSGTTWSTKYNISKNIATYNQLAPSIAIDSSNNLYVVWHGMHAVQTTRNQIRFSKSTDSGITWSAPTNITDSAVASQTYSSISIDSLNNLHVLWFGGITIGTTTTTAQYLQYIRSGNGGNSWDAATALNWGGNTVTESVYPSTIWANFPTIGSVKTNIPTRGYAYVYGIEQTYVVYAKNGTLTWGDSQAPSSNVNAISSYWKKSALMLTVTATDTGGSGLKNVTLYYYNSSNNATFYGPWNFGVNATPWKNPSAISWSFTSPKGTGYYRFYSRAADNATNTEVAPVTNDTMCGYNNIPTINNPYPPNGSTGIPLIPTLSIAISDLDGNTMTIIWYSNSSGLWKQFGRNNSCVNGTYRWKNNNFSSPITTYYWRVNITDGINYNQTTFSFTTKFVPPVIGSYDLRNASGSKLNNATGLLDVNKEYYFTVTITDLNEWSDVDYVDIKAWYDNGSDSTTYNNSGNLGGNLNMHLQYVNTTGVASWKMLWPHDEAKLIPANCTETIIDATTRIIDISFKPFSQVRWANSNNTWDSTQNITNDPYSWNFDTIVTGASGLKTWKTDEYGIYKFNSILPGQNWVGVVASPGFNDTSNIVTITYSPNYNYIISIYFEENLTNETSGHSIPIANNVYILANADPNDDITVDKVFTGIGEANAIEIINRSGIFNKNNLSENVHVQFNVYIPFGTIGGKYTAHVATKIQHKT